jgi:hypothetical protein
LDCATARSHIKSRIWLRSSASSADVGSSAISNRGPLANIMAIMAR